MRLNTTPPIASTGIAKVGSAFGKTQENWVLWLLLQVFPDSSVLEVSRGFFHVGLEIVQLVTVDAWNACCKTLCDTGTSTLMPWSDHIPTLLLRRPGCTSSPTTRCCAAPRRASWSAPRQTRWCGTRRAASGVPRRAAAGGCPTPAVARRAWASLKWWKSRIGVPLQLPGRWLRCIGCTGG